MVFDLFRKTLTQYKPVRLLATFTLVFGLTVGIITQSIASDAVEQTRAQEIIKSLHWIEAGSKGSIESAAVINIPDGYAMLNPADTKKVMELMHNPTGESNEYFFGPKDHKWFAVLGYDGSTGYVKDDEKVDASAVLESIKQGTEVANVERKKHGWSPFQINGWRFPPRYDNSQRRLEWAIDGSSDGHQVVNYNTRILGRKGVTSVVLVAAPEVLDESVNEFNKAITNFSYMDGERYEQFTQGDKIAEYGLAALITGGAAAVAAKTGFWKVIVGFFAAFWKAIVAIVVACLASFRKIFSRKQQ